MNIFFCVCSFLRLSCPIHLYLIFEKSSLEPFFKNQVGRTWFLVYFELDLTACVDSKTAVKGIWLDDLDPTYYLDSHDLISDTSSFFMTKKSEKSIYCLFHFIKGDHKPNDKLTKTTSEHQFWSIVHLVFGHSW